MRIFKETNQGQNQEHVRFIADNGYFEGGGSQIDKFTETTFFIDSTYDGMAVVNYIFPSSPSSTGIKTIKIEAIKNNITWVNKKIFARCFVDAETSKLRPPNCHETTDSVSKTKEIKGDGYPDVPFFDTLKSIKVEIDYAGSYISHSTVQSALQYCKEILSTAKLDTSNVNFSIDENISTMEAWLIPQKIKEYLAQYRTHRDCIHLILGSKTSPGQIYKYLGVTILYFVPDANFTFARFANFASGKDSIKAQCILDSTGIFVCVSRIDSIVNDSGCVPISVEIHNNTTLTPIL